MKKYVMPVEVSAFRIKEIEGYPNWPMRTGDKIEKLGGDLRMVYSTDPADRSVCVDSSFTNQINAGDYGVYVQLPSGHAMYMTAEEFATAATPLDNEYLSVLYKGGMSFSEAFELAKRGARIYRASWGRNSYVMVEEASGSGVLKDKCLIKVTKVGHKHPLREPWMPDQQALFKNDWFVYGGSV